MFWRMHRTLSAIIPIPTDTGSLTANYTIVVNTSISSEDPSVRVYTYSHASGRVTMISPTKMKIGGAVAIGFSP